MGYQFDYPLGTHCVRTSNLAEPADFLVAFGALIALEPNDSVIYGDAAAPTHFTRMRVLANAYDTAIDAEAFDLSTLAGTLPLLRYDPAEAVVEATTLGGMPAVRVSGIPIGPEGAEATEIIAAFEGLVYQIVIEPVTLGLGFDPDVEYALDTATYEEVLSSWRFVPQSG